MSGLRIGVFLALLATSPEVQGEDYPPFRTGRNDVAFEAKALQATDAQLKRRFGFENDPPAYDIAKEKILVIVPKPYRHADARGLFVWIDASPAPVIPRDWEPVLAEKKLLLVAAHDTGNARSVFDRCRIAGDAFHNMKKRFPIDPKWSVSQITPWIAWPSALGSGSR